MKKILIITAIVFAMGIITSSCNKHVCPAYVYQDETPIEETA